MRKLPDPREYRLRDGLSKTGKVGSAAVRAAQHGTVTTRVREIGRLLEADREVELRRAIDAAATPGERRDWLDAVGHALMPAAGNERPAVLLFAIPVLLVSGGKAGTVIPAVLPDVGAVQRLLQEAGVLGPTKSFGLSNALTSAASLEGISWTTLYRWATGAHPVERFDLALPPEEIVLRSDTDQVDLRFLSGAAVTAAGTPTFLETAGSIGQWGMGFTRTLVRQLALPGASLLPLARPPMSFPAALREGRFALAELGFQLFMSRAVRNARMQFGEPDVAVAAHADGTVRVRLTAKLDPSYEEEYRWELQPADDLEVVSSSILGLLDAVRLEGVSILETVQPADA